MSSNRQLLERVLDNRASAWAGPGAALPLVLAIILLGTITFRVGKQTAPIIEKILTPPQVRPQEKIEFEEAAPERKFDNVFQEFSQDQTERFSIPDPTADLNVPEIETVTRIDETDVAMSEMPDQQAKWEATSPTVEVPGSVLVDPSTKTLPTRDTTGEEAALRRASTRQTTGDGVAATLAADGAGANLGQDKSGDVTPVAGLDAPVVVRRSASAPGPAVGISEPASAEKQSLTGWILRNPSPLRPAVQEALGYSSLKADRTSVGSVVDESGTLYQFYFLHRTENNLLRILVVVDDQAYRIDLPDFFLEANHVKTGYVSRGLAPADSFAPGPIIEVSLEAVSAIPAEVPEVFDLVLRWLEIKGQE